MASSTDTGDTGDTGDAAAHRQSHDISAPKLISIESTHDGDIQTVEEATIRNVNSAFKHHLHHSWVEPPGPSGDAEGHDESGGKARLVRHRQNLSVQFLDISISGEEAREASGGASGRRPRAAPAKDTIEGATALCLAPPEADAATPSPHVQRVGEGAKDGDGADFTERVRSSWDLEDDTAVPRRKSLCDDDTEVAQALPARRGHSHSLSVTFFDEPISLESERKERGERGEGRPSRETIDGTAAHCSDKTKDGDEGSDSGSGSGATREAWKGPADMRRNWLSREREPARDGGDDNGDGSSTHGRCYNDRPAAFFDAPSPRDTAEDPGDVAPHQAAVDAAFEPPPPVASSPREGRRLGRDSPLSPSAFRECRGDASAAVPPRAPSLATESGSGMGSGEEGRVMRKHRRVFSGRSNPALVHRRVNTRGDKGVADLRIEEDFQRPGRKKAFSDEDVLIRAFSDDNVTYWPPPSAPLRQSPPVLPPQYNYRRAHRRQQQQQQHSEYREETHFNHYGGYHPPQSYNGGPPPPHPSRSQSPYNLPQSMPQPDISLQCEHGTLAPPLHYNTSPRSDTGVDYNYQNSPVASGYPSRYPPPLQHHPAPQHPAGYSQQRPSPLPSPSYPSLHHPHHPQHQPTAPGGNYRPPPPKGLSHDNGSTYSPPLHLSQPALEENYQLPQSLATATATSFQEDNGVRIYSKKLSAVGLNDNKVEDPTPPLTVAARSTEKQGLDSDPVPSISDNDFANTNVNARHRKQQSSIGSFLVTTGIFDDVHNDLFYESEGYVSAPEPKSDESKQKHPSHVTHLSSMSFVKSLCTDNLLNSFSDDTDEDQNASTVTKGSTKVDEEGGNNATDAPARGILSEEQESTYLRARSPPPPSSQSDSLQPPVLTVRPSSDTGHPRHSSAQPPPAHHPSAGSYFFHSDYSPGSSAGYPPSPSAGYASTATSPQAHPARQSSSLALPTRPLPGSIVTPTGYYRYDAWPPQPLLQQSPQSPSYEPPVQLPPHGGGVPNPQHPLDQTSYNPPPPPVQHQHSSPRSHVYPQPLQMYPSPHQYIQQSPPQHEMPTQSREYNSDPDPGHGQLESKYSYPQAATCYQPPPPSRPTPSSLYPVPSETICPPALPHDKDSQLKRKAARRQCSFPSCPNRVVQGGLCIAHGAKRKVCSRPGCTKNVKKAGFCSAHGPARKRCEVPGCGKVSVQGGRCIAHGAKKKVCSYAGKDGREPCRKQAILGGMCKKHYDDAHGVSTRRIKSLRQQEGTEGDSGKEGGEGSNPRSTEVGPKKNGNHQRGLSLFQDTDLMDTIINNGVPVENDGLRGLSIES